MGTPETIPKKEMLRLPERREPPSVEQFDAPVNEEAIHPLHRLQSMAGNSFLQARLARQGAGSGQPQAGIATLTALQRAGQGMPLSSAARAKLEFIMGVDLGDVRVHTDEVAQAASVELRARAFAAGKDIYFAPGQYDPETAGGRDLLAHELGHIFQPGGIPVFDPNQVEAAPPDPLQAQIKPAESAPPAATIPEISSEPEPEAAPAPEAGPTVEPEEQAAVKEVPAAQETPTETAPEGAAVEAEAPQVPTEAEGAPGGPAEIEILMPAPPAELSPQAQERVTTSQRHMGRASATTRAMPNAESSTAAARGAVTEPQEEIHGRAELALASGLVKRAEPSPELVALCDEIRAAIREKRPVDEEDLVDAEPEKMASQAGSQLDASVEGDAQRVQGSYNEINNPPSGEAALKRTDIDSPPAKVNVTDPNAAEAVPDAIPPEKVSLDADVAQVDERITSAGMNSETAQLVQEGPIAEARQARGELATAAQQDPAEVLARQDAALEEARGNLAALQDKALVSLAENRSKTVTGVRGKQNKMVGTEEQMRQSLSRQARDIFSDAQKQVNEQIGILPRTAMDMWTQGVQRYSLEFRQHLDRVRKWIDERHSGVGGAIVGLWDKATGLPDWVTDNYDAAEKKFGDDICGLILEISSKVNTVVAACEAIIAGAQREIDHLFTQNLPKELQAWAEGERKNFSGQLSGLHDKVISTRDHFNQDIARKAVTTVKEVQEEVNRLREEAKGLIGRVADAIAAFIDDPIRAIINGLLSLVGISPATFWALIAKIEQVISDIADDPMKFVNNLVDALGQGFSLFFDNIGKHLLQGLIDWLFSGLGSVGVQIPGEFSVKSVVTFFLQLMGLTWPNIRKILVRHIGEKNVALIEKVWGLISKLIELGPEGILEMIKEQLDPQRILDQVLSAAIDFVKTALIKNVTIRIIALFNPVGAIAQAIELIYKLLKWIFENAARIFTFVETIVNGVADLIAGNIGGMAKAVESALARLIPPVIDFLASLIGLDDLPDKVVETVKKLQEWVLSLVDRAIGWFVAQGKKLLEALGIQKKEKPAGAEGELGPVGDTVTFSGGGESHRLWIKESGTTTTVMVASQEETVGQRLGRWKFEASRKLAKEQVPVAEGLIAQAVPQLSATEKEAYAAELAKQQAEAQAKAATGTGEEAPAPSNAAVQEFQKEDEKTVQEEQTLSQLLAQLFDLFGEKRDLTIIYAAQLARTDPYARSLITETLKSSAEQFKEANNWEEIKTKLNAIASIQEMILTPLNISHLFGQRASDDQAIPALRDALVGANMKEEFIGEAKTYVQYRKQFIHAGNPPFVNSRAQLALQVFEASKKADASKTLQDEFTNRLKNDKFAHLNRDDVRKAVEAAASTAPPDWAAVFATGGTKLRGRTRDGQEYALTMMKVWESQKITPDFVIQLSRDAVEMTITADPKFKSRISGIETAREIATDIATNLVFKIAQTPLYFVKQTDIPRYFVEGPHLICNPDPLARQAYYQKIAATSGEKALADLDGQIHHFVPLYLGGGSEVSNLVAVEQVAHQTLHQFIDELEIGEALGVINGYGLDWSSLDAAFPDDSLIILIGTIKQDGSITYKESDPKLAYIVAKDEKGF